MARRRDRLEELAARITAGAREHWYRSRRHVEAAVRAAVERTVAEFGRLDIVVANAGVMLLGPIVDAPAEEWQRMVDINVLGLLYTAHAALPHLLDGRRAGRRGGWPTSS